MLSRIARIFHNILQYFWTWLIAHCGCYRLDTQCPKPFFSLFDLQLVFRPTQSHLVVDRDLDQSYINCNLYLNSTTQQQVCKYIYLPTYISYEKSFDFTEEKKPKFGRLLCPYKDLNQLLLRSCPLTIKRLDLSLVQMTPQSFSRQSLVQQQYKYTLIQLSHR